MHTYAILLMKFLSFYYENMWDHLLCSRRHTQMFFLLPKAPKGHLQKQSLNACKKQSNSTFSANTMNIRYVRQLFLNRSQKVCCSMASSFYCIRAHQIFISFNAFFPMIFKVDVNFLKTLYNSQILFCRCVSKGRRDEEDEWINTRCIHHRTAF